MENDSQYWHDPGYWRDSQGTGKSSAAHRQSAYARRKRMEQERPGFNFYGAKIGDREQIAFLVLIFLWLIGAGR